MNEVEVGTEGESVVKMRVIPRLQNQINETLHLYSSTYILSSLSILELDVMITENKL